MALFGLYLSSVLLLLGAGTAKTIRPHGTSRALAEALEAWPYRRGVWALRLGALCETALATTGIVYPVRAVVALVAVSYAAFALFVLWATLRGGVLATCGCFGTPDTPPTAGHLLINILATAAAAYTAVAQRGGYLWDVLTHHYDHGVLLPVSSAVLAGFMFLVLVPLSRLQALRAAHDPLGVGAP
jgi:hypothetical protein